MALREVVGGIAAEIKCETRDVVEIKPEDILKNESDGEDDPFSVEYDESDEDDPDDPFIRKDHDSLYSTQPKNFKSKNLEDLNLPKSNFNNDFLGEQIRMDKDKENMLKINDEKNNDKSSKELTTKANMQTKEKLILNYTTNENLLEKNKDIKLAELKANKDLLQNNKEVELESNKDLLKKNKNVELEVDKNLNSPYDWSEIYRTHEGTCTNQDTCKVKVTRVPTTYVSRTEYTVGDLNKFRCNLCQFVTNQKKYVAKHIRTMHRNVTKTYECPYCPFKSKYSLKYHIISMHKSVNEIKWFRCDQCDYKSKLKTTLTNHLLSHLDSSQMIDRMKRCDLCPKMYKTGDALRRHVLSFHKKLKGKVKKLKCTDCEYECKMASLLRNHRDAYHSNLENMDTLQCPNCSYKTKLKYKLKVHLNRTHKDSMLQCEKCAYQTNLMIKMKMHLISHKEIKEDDDLKYRCDKCDYKTYRLYSLNIHKLNHLKPEEIQFFYCYHCNFKAKRKDNLKTHVLRHFKRSDVSIQCYICDFSTTKRHILINHIGKHSKNDNKPEKIVTTKTTIGVQINKPPISPNDNHSEGLIDVENQEKTKVNKPDKMADSKTRVSARIKQQKNRKSKVGLFPSKHKPGTELDNDR